MKQTKKLKTIELFCGTKSFSKFVKDTGHEVFTVDIDNKFYPSLIQDLLQKFPELLKQKIKDADIIWMSPPCQTLSMASGNTHWDINKSPKTQQARDGRDMILLCQKIADYCSHKEKLYFIENPRARARWFLPKETRKTVWYCQYGDERAKPTDIWTNLKGWQGQQCHNGNKNCHHQPAPRGSKTGTQGRKNAKERGIIPQGLFEELFRYIFLEPSNNRLKNTKKTLNLTAFT